MVDFPTAPNKLFGALQAQVDATKNAKPGGPAPAPGGPDPKVDQLVIDMAAVQTALADIKLRLDGIDQTIADLPTKGDVAKAVSDLDATLRPGFANLDERLSELRRELGEPAVSRGEFDELKLYVETHVRGGKGK